MSAALESTRASNEGKERGREGRRKGGESPTAPTHLEGRHSSEPLILMFVNPSEVAHGRVGVWGEVVGGGGGRGGGGGGGGGGRGQDCQPYLCRSLAV